MTIVDQIKKGEGKSLEFKELLPSSEQLCKTIIAFANMGGGKLLLGVSDHGETKGLADADPAAYSDRISNIVHDCIHPVVVPDIYTLSIDDKSIIVVEVYPSPLKPHFLKSKGKADGTFIRVAATNKQADAEYIQELERQRLNISFDEDICSDISFDEFDVEALIHILSERLQRVITNSDLFNLKLLKKQGDKVYLTNAAMIVSAGFDFVRVRCARFKGTNMDIFIDQKEFTGNLFEQFESSMKFLLLNINLHGELGPDHIHRIDTYEIPPEALREAVINAIVHRDYVISGSDIKIAVFDDRIEITSPGGFPRGITVEDILSGRSEIRNRIIARLFKEAGLIENWGRGIGKIIKACEKCGLKRPDIIESGMFVKFVFYREIEKSWSDDAARKNRPEKIDQKNRPEKADRRDNEKIVEAILGLIKDNAYISRREIAYKLGLSDSSVKRRLEKLSKSDQIRRIGPDKGGYWIINMESFIYIPTKKARIVKQGAKE